MSRPRDGMLGLDVILLTLSAPVLPAKWNKKVSINFDLQSRNARKAVPFVQIVGRVVASYDNY